MTFMLLFSRFDVQGTYGILIHVFLVVVFLQILAWADRVRPGLQQLGILIFHARICRYKSGFSVGRFRTGRQL